MSLNAKAAGLMEALRGLRSVLVAYSGGVDSAYLAWAARQALGEQMLAVLADSPSLGEYQRSHAVEFARAFDIPLEVIHTGEFENPLYIRNQPDRCFHCKDELFGRLCALARERGFAALAYGANADDVHDFRPGHRAAAEHGVRSPLLDAGLTKSEIRQLARSAGLPLWDRPAAPCLSSRVAYGIPVTISIMKLVESGEEALRALGFRVFRVRHHGDLVRIEIAAEEMAKALDVGLVERLNAIFRGLGYKYVTLDLQGFRSGSLNPAQKPDV